MSGFSIPWFKPSIGAEELAEVQQAFSDNWLTQGPRVQRFEEAIAQRVGVPHAIAVSNGSVAIDIVLTMVGVHPGDEVIVPSMTYYATAAAVSRIGATPVFVDVDPATGNLDPEKLAEAASPLTRAAIFIDYGGGPADVARLKKEAQRLGIHLIQDAAQSLGAIYDGKPMGAETEISTMSFHMAKIISTVEGGMIFTHNSDYAKEARIYRNQGETSKYMHGRLGHNARMTDISAAIGLRQIEKLDRHLTERARVAERYNSHFRGHNKIRTTPCTIPGAKHSNFFYPILVENRPKVEAALKVRGIDYRIAYPLPVQEQEVYASGRAPSRSMVTPGSAEFTQKVLNPPMFPDMTTEMIDKVAQTICEAVE
jgi:dTDP-4-amino-4,6-dideoxygalactose transaminase